MAHTPLSMCPDCGKWLDGCTGVCGGTEEPVKMDDESQPNEGDITICLACGAVLKFAKDLRVEKLEEEDLNKIREDPDTAMLIERIKVAARVVNSRYKEKYGTELN